MACLRVTPLGRVGFFSLAEFELEAESAVEVEPEGKICRGTVVLAPSQVEVNQATEMLDPVTTTILGDG